jgi:hypothetical protein
VEHQLAARRGGIDRLLQATEPDPALGKPAHGADQVAQRPAKPVKLPHHQGVTGADLVEDLLEDGAVG